MITKEKTDEYLRVIADTLERVKKDRATIRRFFIDGAKDNGALIVAMGNYGTAEYDNMEVLRMMQQTMPKFFSAFKVYGTTYWEAFPAMNVKTMAGRFTNFFQYVDKKSYNDFLGAQSKVLERNKRRRLYNAFCSAFNIGDIVKISDESVRKLLQKISKYDLEIALKGVAASVKNKIFRNMPKDVASTVKEDMEFMGPVLNCEVLKKQKEIALALCGLYNLNEIEFQKKVTEEVKPLPRPKYYNEGCAKDESGTYNSLGKKFIDMTLRTQNIICANRLLVRNRILKSAFDKSIAQEVLGNYGVGNFDKDDFGEKFEECLDKYLDAFYQYAVTAGQVFLMEDINRRATKNKEEAATDGNKTAGDNCNAVSKGGDMAGDKECAKFSIFMQCVELDKFDAFCEGIKRAGHGVYSMIKKYTFNIDSFLTLSDKEIQKVLSVTNQKDFLFMLYGASDEVKEKFFRNCSKGEAKSYKSELASLKDVSLKSAFQAKCAMIEIVLNLYHSGEVELFCDKLCM